MGLLIVWSVAQHNLSIAVQRYAIFRIRQIFRCKPEIEGVLRHLIQGPAGCDRRCAGTQSLGIKLADKRNVSHRVRPIFRPEVKIIR